MAVAPVLGTHRVRRPRPGLRWPLAYRSAEAYDHRSTLLAANRSLLATRGAELAIVHRPLPLRALARAGYALAWLRHGVRAGWTRVRAAQFTAAVRRRRTPDTRLDNLDDRAGPAAARPPRLAPARPRAAGRGGRVRPGARRRAPAPDPRARATARWAWPSAPRCAPRAPGTGSRWSGTCRRATPPPPRATVADDALRARRSPARRTAWSPSATGWPANSGARHGLSTLPTVVRNAPPLTTPAPVGADGGVRARCHLGPETPLLVHTGPVTPDRGPSTVVEALPKLYDLHAAFVVPDPDHPAPVGTARAGRPTRRPRAAARAAVRPRARRSPPSSPPPTSACSRCTNSRTTRSVLATRYFEYAHARLPVVVSDVRAMAAATLELGNGEVFRARDTADFVRAVGAVLTNPRRYRKAYDRVDILTPVVLADPVRPAPRPLRPPPRPPPLIRSPVPPPQDGGGSRAVGRVPRGPEPPGAVPTRTPAPAPLPHPCSRPPPGRPPRPKSR